VTAPTSGDRRTDARRVEVEGETFRHEAVRWHEPAPVAAADVVIEAVVTVE
jgi:hypothetical protein